MTKSKKLVVSLSVAAAVVLYLAAPFPLVSYIARHPNWEDQLGGGMPSRIFHWLYNPWIPKLSQDNPYRALFIAHVRQLCVENPAFCPKEPPKQP